MHSIERYGIVALLFLVVTVVAVLMWDGGKKKKPVEALGKNPAPVVEASAPRAIEPENRLSLVAPSQPGPLLRALDGAGAGRPEDAQAARGAGQPLGQDARADVPPQPEAQSSLLRPHDEPAPPERPIATAPAAATRAYVVKGGDTLSEIAQRELGSSRRWQEITALNPGLDPARLRSGKTIRLPGGERSSTAGGERASAPVADGGTKEKAAASTRTHKVGKGENLWKIAALTLGDGKRWKEIAALNPAVNPERLVLGQVLKLPAGAKAAGGSPESTRVTATKPTKSAEPLVAAADEPRARRGGKVK